MSKWTPSSYVRAGSFVAAVAILAFAWREGRRLHTPPAVADAYHARVLAAAALLPDRIGSWVGSDVPLPPAAVDMLQPNLLMSRRYTDVDTGRQVSFLLVQCRDARDLLGHYPPVCYKSQGYKLSSRETRNVSAGDLAIRTTRYVFTHEQLDKAPRLAVENFMVLPSGQTCPNMDEVERSARDHRTRFFGAAQVQMVCDAGLPGRDRDALVTHFAQASRPVVDVIRSGVVDASK